MARVAEGKPKRSSSATLTVVKNPSEVGGEGRRVQAWRAWAGCGDGVHVHLIIDPPARQMWLLPAEELNIRPRSA